MNKPKMRPLEARWRRYALAGGVIAIIGSLIYLEQIPVLYVLSTLALIAVLLAVAFSDLEAVGVQIDETEKTAVDEPKAAGR